ncbi:MAG: ABC transporter permease [Candidatus Hydrogenedentes bacterium]|nr:ABC transporter permease [Candidatus Hydrogenedentota bacterium]
MIRLALNSLRHYAGMHLGVLLGVVLATAVLTGALLVGDSVDHSLSSFAQMRLGGTQHAITTRNQFFNQRLATALAEKLTIPTTGLLHLRGMAIHQGAESSDRTQINRVEVLGIGPEFWKTTEEGATYTRRDEGPELVGVLVLQPSDTALSTKLATALGVSVGDEVALRIERPSLLPRDAGLSISDDDRSIRRLYTVTKIVGDDEMGRYSLSANQVAPYNAFVNRTALQAQIELPEHVNVLLTGGDAPLEEVQAALGDVWQASDSGLRVVHYPGDQVQVESERVFLSEEVASLADSLEHAQGTLTYLVNELRKGDGATPYSFMVAGPVPETLKDDEIVINRWLADTLQADVGDAIDVAYYELLPSNKFEERTRTFTVALIREMDDLKMERALSPIFPGLSDVDNCADWDVGMPLDEEKLDDEANEAYWDEYRQTPKALVTLAAGQAMWGNRFGQYTAVRVPGDKTMVATLNALLKERVDPELLGLKFNPVKEQATAAVSGAMDFGGLFIGMSFFIIGAALLLTGLLFTFGVQHRTAELGMLLAVGFRPRQVRRLFLAEGALLGLIGTIAGAGLATLYPRALLYGLAHYWQGALANAAIQYHATTGTLIMGAVISFVCAVGTMYLSLRRHLKQPARELLQMDFTQALSTRSEGRKKTLGALFSNRTYKKQDDSSSFPRTWESRTRQEHTATPLDPRVRGDDGRWSWVVGEAHFSLYLGIAGLAITVALYFAPTHNAALIGFGAGSLLLASVLLLCRYALMTLQGEGTLSLHRLAIQNVARRRGRSLATVALLACGAFMVFAVSAMQEDLYANAHLRSAGTGGFTLMAESTFPLQESPLQALDDPALSGTALKVRDGDDASCLNLNYSQAPGVVGVNVDDLVSRGAFASEAAAKELWERLNLELPDGAIPALAGDTNTAMWTLRKKAAIKGGGQLTYEDEGGVEQTVQLVGALPMRLSIFQGKILISDTNFTRLFPSEEGYRMFLIDAPVEESAALSQRLNKKFDRYGMNAFPPVERILEFYAVETTYLAMFLVLGGLGLAIGCVGMGVIVLRNLLERRAELAMLSALGFPKHAVLHMLYAEYGFLLLAGLGTGVLAASLAVIPSFYATNSTVDVAIQVQLAILVFIVSVGCTASAILLGFRKEQFDALRDE